MNEAWNRILSLKKKDRKKSGEGLYREMNKIFLLVNKFRYRTNGNNAPKNFLHQKYLKVN